MMMVMMVLMKKVKQKIRWFPIRCWQTRAEFVCFRPDRPRISLTLNHNQHHHHHRRRHQQHQQHHHSRPPHSHRQHLNHHPYKHVIHKQQFQIQRIWLGPNQWKYVSLYQFNVNQTVDFLKSILTETIFISSVRDPRAGCCV